MMEMKFLMNSLGHFVQNIKIKSSIRGSNFILDSVQHMYYKCHKINSKRGGLYIVSLDQIKNKAATINPKNEDDKCFQFAGTVVLNYEV